jgi:hypothetical protein
MLKILKAEQQTSGSTEQNFLWVAFTHQYTKDYEDYDNYDRYDGSFELQSLKTYNFTKSEI